MQKALTWEWVEGWLLLLVLGIDAFLAGDVLPKATMGMTAGVLRGGNTDLAKHCSNFASRDALVVSMS